MYDKRTKQFFLPMIPPTVTSQEKGETIRCGKIHHYEKPEVAAAREKFKASLAKYRPDQPFDGSVRLFTQWLYPVKGNHRNGEYKTTKPDTDNALKLFKDAMTDLGFWHDDAQVASEITEKFYANITGIFVKVEEITNDQTEAGELHTP